MTKRMARMHAMMTTPPTATSLEAHRSMTMRRPVRSRLTTSGRAGGAGPPAARTFASMATLLDLRELFLRDRGRNGGVAVLDHALLALPGEDHLHEFSGQWIERLAGRLVDVDEEEARHGIGPGVGVVSSGLDTLAAVLLAERHGPHPGRGVADPAVSRREAVHRHALDHRRRSRLLLDGVLVIAVLHHVLLEEAVGARGRVAPVEAGGLLGPLAGQPELTPRHHILLVPGPARLREDRVPLAHAEALDGVVLVDEDDESVDGRPDRQRLVAELLLELVDLGPLHLPRHRAQLGRARDEGRRSRRRSLALDLDLGVGIEAAEALRPVRHEVVERVRADTRDVAADAADRLVGLQSWIQLHLAAGHRQARPEHGDPEDHRHDRLLRHVVSFVR